MVRTNIYITKNQAIISEFSISEFGSTAMFDSHVYRTGEIWSGYINRISKSKRNKYIRKVRQKARLEVLTHYGGNPPRCGCCGENHLQFLGIDHINGGGSKHRREFKIGGSFYPWLRQNNYPIGYQVLCHNCNLAKGFYGACPHGST